MMQIYEKTKEFLEHPETLQLITDTIKNGGSLTSLCQLESVMYSRVHDWLMIDPDRKNAYESALDARAEWFVQRIIDELTSLSFIDLRQAYDENGRLKAPSEWPKQLSAAINSVESEELYEGQGKEREQVGWTKKIKLTDKLKAIELLGKQYKMFIDRHQHEAKFSFEDLIDMSMKQDTKTGEPEQRSNSSN